jgi:hypothetical protein
VKECKAATSTTIKTSFNLPICTDPMSQDADLSQYYLNENNCEITGYSLENSETSVTTSDQL